MEMGENGDEEKVMDRKGKHLLLHELFCVDNENVWTSISQMLPHYTIFFFPDKTGRLFLHCNFAWKGTMLEIYKCIYFYMYI